MFVPDVTQLISSLKFKDKCDESCSNEVHVVIGSVTFYLIEIGQTIHPINIQLVSCGSIYHKCITMFSPIQSEPILPSYQITKIRNSSPSTISFQLTAFRQCIVEDFRPVVLPLQAIFSEYTDAYLSNGYLLPQDEQVLSVNLMMGLSKLYSRSLTGAEIITLMNQNRYHKRDIFPTLSTIATTAHVYEINFPPETTIDITNIFPNVAILSIPKESYEHFVSSMSQIRLDDRCSICYYFIPPGQSFKDTNAFKNPDILFITVYLQSENRLGLQNLLRLICKFIDIVPTGIFPVHISAQINSTQQPEQKEHTVPFVDYSNNSLLKRKRDDEQNGIALIKKCPKCSINKPNKPPYFGTTQSSNKIKKFCNTCLHTDHSYNSKQRVYPMLLSFLTSQKNLPFETQPDINFVTIVADIIHFGMVQLDIKHELGSFFLSNPKRPIIDPLDNLETYEDETPFTCSLRSLVEKLAIFCMYDSPSKPGSFVLSKSLIDFVRKHVSKKISMTRTKRIKRSVETPTQEEQEEVDEVLKKLIIQYETELYCHIYELYSRNEQKQTPKQSLKTIHEQIQKWMKEHDLEEIFLKENPFLF